MGCNKGSGRDRYMNRRSDPDPRFDGMGRGGFDGRGFDGFDRGFREERREEFLPFEPFPFEERREFREFPRNKAIIIAPRRPF